MTRRIRIRDGVALEQILATNKRWFENLADIEQDRLSKEVSDLIYNGQMMGDQGAAFSSKRTISLGDETIILDARFGPQSIFRRIAGLFEG